ncbi:TPA: hypothetical protein ACGGR3_002160 [Vibrio cholerae]
MIEFLDRPIAFHRIFVELGLGITGALFLSQSLYWSRRTNESGWFYKTQEEWEEETGLSRREQDSARKRLKSLGIIEEKKQGVPCRVFYKVNGEKLLVLLSKRSDQKSENPVCSKQTIQFGEKRQTSLNESANLVCTNPPSSDGGISQTKTENTHRLPETTTKTLSVIEQCFEHFWKIFPTKKAKKQAFDKFKAIVKRRSESPEEFTTMLCADVHARLQNGQFGFDKLHATTYLNQERWNDDHEINRPVTAKSSGKTNRYEEFNEQLLRKYGHTATSVGDSGNSTDPSGLGSGEVHGGLRGEVASQGVTIDLGSGDFYDVSGGGEEGR